MNWINLRTARPEDVDAIWELEKICFQTPWSRADFERDISENILATYMVAYHKEQLVAYAGIWVVLDEGHITNVAVHPDFRNQGIATMILVELLNRAREKGATRFTLEVSTKNDLAIALYEKFGFRNAGCRKEYYEGTKEDAMIMWLYEER
jgi:ribosomal-protein-alanine N-acetyltransferase